MAQQPLTAVVDLLARVPAFESAAGRGLLVDPELGPVNRFDNDRQADLLSIARAADAAGVINEMLLVASTLAGETQLGADLKNLRVGLRSASIESVLNGSVQRIPWQWQPYRLSAEPGWRATLTLRGRPHTSTGGPPSTEIVISPGELFGRGGLAHARCEIVLERLAEEGNAPRKISYTVLLSPSWQGTAAKTIVCLVAAWSCFAFYLFGRQPRVEEPQSVGLAVGLSIACAVLVILVTGWRPRAEAFQNAAGAPVVACLALAVALGLPFFAGPQFYVAQNPGPACKPSKEQYWDQGAWMLMTRKDSLSCWPAEIDIDKSKKECWLRQLTTSGMTEKAHWDHVLLGVFGAQARRVGPYIENVDSQCKPRLPPVETTKVFNCTDQPVLVGNAGKRLEREATGDFTAEERKSVSFEGGTPSGALLPPNDTVWQLSQDKDTWFAFSQKNESPVLTAPQGKASFKVHVNCNPQKLTVRGEGGYWELEHPNNHAVHTLEHCDVAPSLISKEKKLDLNVGVYRVEDVKRVEKWGLWIADEPTEPLDWAKPVCVNHRAGRCRVEAQPRRDVRPGEQVGALLPCPQN